MPMRLPSRPFTPALMPLIAALVFDYLLPDPPNRWHPVAWMGSMIAWLRQAAPPSGAGRQLIYGVGIALGGPLAWGALGWAADRLCRALPPPLNWLGEGLLLRLTFSAGGLARAAASVYQALEANDLPEARRQLGWHLVSRPVDALTAAQVAAAAVESVAENTSDGAVAPLLYYALGGLPAAVAYRCANTADAMLGYRDAEREWLGKASARLDDLLNIAPARLTALLLMLVSRHPRAAWRTWHTDSARTASPNAGHPMSAAAGALGVSLEKVGHYVLNPAGRAPQAADIRRAVRLMRAALGLGSLLLMGAVMLRRRR